MRRIWLVLLLVLVLSGCSTLNTPITDPVIDDPVIDGPTVTEPTQVELYNRLFDDTNKKSFTIEITSTELYKLDNIMKSYFNQFGHYKTDEVVESKLTYEDESGSFTIDHVAFRGKGNTSRVRLINDQGELQLSSYKVYFDKPLYMVDGSLEYEAIKDRTVFNMTELNFKINRNWDSTYLTEKYAYDLFRSFGVDAPHITLATLYVKVDGNTTKIGVVSVIESVDEALLEKNFTGIDGNLYKVLWQQYGPATLENNYPVGAIGIKDESVNYFPAYDLKTNKKTADFSDIETLIQMLNTMNGTYYKQFMDANFEVDKLLRMLAIGVLLGNPDDYRAMGNNYYLYHADDTYKWTMIPYDYDHGLGQGWDGSPVFNNHTIGFDIYTWGNLNTAFLGYDVNHPLTDKLLVDDSYQLVYEGYLKELLDENLFSFDHFNTLYLEAYNLYASETSDALLNQSFGLRNVSDYINQKRADIYDQLNNYSLHPNLRPNTL